MWIAQHAGILADGYNISASDTFDRRPGADANNIGVVCVQGESGGLRSLVAMFDAVRSVDRPNGFVEWVAYDEGVMIKFVEEPPKS